MTDSAAAGPAPAPPAPLQPADAGAAGRADLEAVNAALAAANAQLQDQQLELELANQQLQEQAAELEAQAEELQATAAHLEEQTEAADRARRAAEAARARTAGVLEATAVDCILVGDSAAMVMHGHTDTLAATVDLMAMHTAAVRRGAPTRFLIADLPFLSFRKGVPAALDAVAAMMRAGAQAIA